MTVGLLLDTHIVLAVIGEIERPLPKSIHARIGGGTPLNVSVATLWELAIKVRLGKLGFRFDLAELPHICESYDLAIVHILPSHVIADVQPEPTTRDPFDRLLLCQCAVEGLRLVTLDRALIEHPLAIGSSEPD